METFKLTFEQTTVVKTSEIETTPLVPVTETSKVTSFTTVRCQLERTVVKHDDSDVFR